MRGKKCDLSILNNFSSLLLLVTDNNNNDTALIISELGFSQTIVSRVCTEFAKNKKNPSSYRQFCGKREVRGEQPDWLDRFDLKDRMMRLQ